MEMDVSVQGQYDCRGEYGFMYRKVPKVDQQHEQLTSVLATHTTPPLSPPLSPPPVQTSMMGDLQERMDHLQATVDLYKGEIKGWDEVTKTRRLHVAEIKQALENERDVDFSQLHVEDVETLKSYLTPEQSSLLSQPLLARPQFREEGERQLDLINSKLEGELKRIQSHCQRTNLGLRQGSYHHTLDMSVMDDTPRTLVRALKQN